MTPLSPPAKRWTALGLFVVAPLVLLILAAANVVDAIEARQEVAQASVQLDRYRARLQAEPAVGSTGSAVAPAFIAAPSRSLAEAELQRRIVSAIDAARAQVVESGAMDVATDAPDNRIEIRATLDVDNAGLFRFLHAIETGMPLMFVEDLAVRRIQIDENETADNGRLRVDAVIRAFWEPASS